LCLAENRRMQQLARKFGAQLNFQSGNVIGELKAPCPTPISVMRELVADGTDLAAAILDVPAQLAKQREYSNGSPERRPRERRYERLVLVDNWRELTANKGRWSKRTEAVFRRRPAVRSNRPARPSR